MLICTTHCLGSAFVRVWVNISLAAVQLGHIVKVHTDIYHHSISEDVHQRAFSALLNRSDRPRPPEIFYA